MKEAPFNALVQRWVVGCNTWNDDVTALLESLTQGPLSDHQLETPTILTLGPNEALLSHGSIVVEQGVIQLGESNQRIDLKQFTLRALLPENGRHRRTILRGRDEALCAASDLLVIHSDLSTAEFDSSFFALRIALALVKPIIWVQRRGSDVTYRLSVGAPSLSASGASTAAPHEPTEIDGAAPNYASAIDRLIQLRDIDGQLAWEEVLQEVFPYPPCPASACVKTLNAWFLARALPVINIDAARALGVADSQSPKHGHPHGHGFLAAPSELETLLRLSNLTVERDGLAWWSSRVAGAWNKLLSSAVVHLLSFDRKNYRLFWDKAVKTWFRAAFRGKSLNQPHINFRYPAPDARLADTGFSLQDNEVAHDAFELADEVALVNSGRYRSAIWLGYLLSAVAVISAAANHVWHGTHPHDPHSVWQGLPLAWVAFLGVLTLLFMTATAALTRLARWAAAKPPRRETCRRLTVWLCLAAVVVAAVGGFGLSVATLISPFAALEIASLATILALVRVVWTLSAHEGWIATRALAEALRYDQLLIPGLAVTRLSAQPPFQIVGGGLSLANGHAWWLGRIRASQPMPQSAVAGTSAVSLARAGYLLGYIDHILKTIRDQIDYHQGRANREHLIDHRLHFVTMVFFSVAAVCASLHVLPSDKSTADWLSLAAIGLPVLGASLHAIKSQLELGRHAQASNDMREALHTQEDALVKLRSQVESAEASSDLVPWDQVAEVRAIAAKAADAMMGDVVDWFELVAAQPMNLPA